MSTANYIASDEASIKQFLFDKLFAPDIKPTDLKPYEVSVAEAKLKIDQYLDNFKKDINKGLILFIQNALKTEQPRLREIWQKIATSLHATNEVNKQKSIVSTDCEFLETIAKRLIISNQTENASCMFRFILQINPSFSSAWVGWAISESAQNNLEIADWIYEMGMAWLPQDHFLSFFAAKYFSATDRKEKALEIIQGSLNRLNEAGEQNSQAYQEMSKLLETLNKKT